MRDYFYDFYGIFSAICGDTLVGGFTQTSPYPFENGLFGTISEYNEVTYDDKGLPSGSENTLAAMQYALSAYSYRQNAMHNMLVFPDTMQVQSLINGETLPSFRQRLIDKGVNLNVMASLSGAACTDGRRPMGLDADGYGYVATSSGGFEYCTVDTSHWNTMTWGRGTLDNYVITALETGGSVWERYSTAISQKTRL